MLNKKTVLLLCLLAALTVTAAACAPTAPSGPKTDPAATVVTASASPDSQQPGSAERTALMDNAGTRLGEVPRDAFCTAADNGIFYSVFNIAEYQFTGTAEYRFFRTSDRQDILLGTLEGQGYEAVFSRTELNGVIYTLALAGNPMDTAADRLLLLVCDPAAGTLHSYTVSEFGFPYALMAAANGRLLILNHEMTSPQTDCVYEFDPAAGTVRAVLTFADGTDFLRGVCAGDNGFYLLRLRLTNGAVSKMFLDAYDFNYNRRSEQEVTDMLINAISAIPSILSRQDALNELGMNVSHFAAADGRYLCYENFGLARVIVDVETKRTIAARSDTYAFAIGGGQPVLYRLDFGDNTGDRAEIYELQNGQLERVAFTPPETHQLLESVSRSPSGTWLALTADSFPTRNGTLMLCMWKEA